MTTETDYHALRDVSERALKTMTHLSRLPTDDELLSEKILRDMGIDIDAIDAFKIMVGPKNVLDLLDELEAKDKRITELEASRAALAAENAGLKSNLIYWSGEDSEPVRSPLDYAHEAGLESGEEFEMQVAARMPDLTYRVVSSSRFRTEIELVGGLFPETPATDAFLAEIRAEARNEGINYTASRLAAAFNHGFINKPLREVFDVTLR